LAQLDALEADLNARLQRGAFRGLPPVTIYDGQIMEAELMARIILSDIDDIRQWDRTHPTHPTSEQRLRTVGTEAQQLLQLARAERDAAG
jgi:hypothetical protein